MDVQANVDDCLSTKPFFSQASNPEISFEEELEESFNNDVPCVICCGPSSLWDIKSRKKMQYTSVLAKLLSCSPSHVARGLLNATYCQMCQELIASIFDIITNISELEKKLRPLKSSIIHNIRNKELGNITVRWNDAGSNTSTAKTYLDLRKLLKEGITKCGGEVGHKAPESDSDRVLSASPLKSSNSLSVSVSYSKNNEHGPFVSESFCDAELSSKNGDRDVIDGTTSPRKRKGALKCIVKCKDESCTRMFAHERYMKVHFRKAHEGSEKPYVCEHCDKSFASRKRYGYHITTHDEPNSEPCPCDKCGKTYGNKHKLRRHVQQCHNKTKKEAKPKREFHCKNCPNVYSSLNALNRHTIVAHTKEYPFHCEVCGQGFASKTDLKYHVGHHYEDDPLKCKECGKTFGTSKDLKYHYRRHTGDYPFRCSVCNKGLSTQTALRRHFATHSDRRDFQCNICQKSYCTIERLKAHRKFHTSERSHLCDVCGKGYLDRRTLEAHYRIHTGEHPYECHICHKKFMHNNYIKKHLAYHERAAQEGRELKIKPNFHRKNTIAPGVLKRDDDSTAEHESRTIEFILTSLE